MLHDEGILQPPFTFLHMYPKEKEMLVQKLSNKRNIPYKTLEEVFT